MLSGGLQCTCEATNTVPTLTKAANASEASAWPLEKKKIPAFPAATQSYPSTSAAAHAHAHHSAPFSAKPGNRGIRIKWNHHAH